MAGVNKVTILGNLGAAPEIRSMPNGDMTATLSVATSRVWKDKTTGEPKELTEWHRIVLYRRLAELAKDYLHKGSKVYIDGYLRTQKWTDDNGIQRWTTQIIAENLQLLDPKAANTKPAEQPEPPADFNDGEIPF
ncbi:single-strand binding protein [Pasteurella testudinis DSM 23072]|uniref:Single-stranded DNA-binding protein n=1 Tax=Pasteurella testudinis DSM 23072 TaxID=1122938 RepID=A0A1W1UMR1_9PAST|nr:single-stranded DNA-binding protein [Pasteurella testudinis]SMB82313.1 single-strand binding protein [Pasteurella testudinis DSM 23072]SUB51488.1 single-stranded DNA-binding protein [Pasteurella testudinis]